MFNALGCFTTLLFQDIQHISATQTPLRFLPMVMMGFGTNILTGSLLDKPLASILVLGASLLSDVACGICHPSPRNLLIGLPPSKQCCLSPVLSNLPFSVSNLVITANFWPNEHTLT